MKDILNIIKDPMIALFITIAFGYLLGKIKYKTFVLGGISGSLIVGVIIGQLGIQIPSSIGGIFFALFIYAVGYQGGSQFFKSLNMETLTLLISATITCILGLITVIVFAYIFHLDRGTAAGLGAGGLTQSAMVGSASSAISQLNLPAATIQQMQANVAVGYAVCYLFGSFGPIILLTNIFPLIMKWDIRKEAIALATKQSGGMEVLEAGQFNAFSQFVTRTYFVSNDSKLIGETLLNLYAKHKPRVSIESIIRNGQEIESDSSITLLPSDIVAVTASRDDHRQISEELGKEVNKPQSMSLIEEKRMCVLTNKKLHGKTIGYIINHFEASKYFGIFIQEVRRFGEKLPLSDDLKLQKGDDIVLVGKTKNLDLVEKQIGKSITSVPVTDFIFFGLGMALGYLFGMISFKIYGTSITLGSGVGCLFSGIVFGWIRSIKPQYGALPMGASNFLRDFGLVVFVAGVGITAGPQAVSAIKNHGLELFILGIGVTLIPQILSFMISYYILRIRNPIVLLAAIAGGRSANPGFAALLEKAGNATPAIAFTSTYVLANIWLTLWGPIIVALVAINIPN